ASMQQFANLLLGLVQVRAVDFEECPATEGAEVVHAGTVCTNVAAASSSPSWHLAWGNIGTDYPDQLTGEGWERVDRRVNTAGDGGEIRVSAARDDPAVVRIGRVQVVIVVPVVRQDSPAESGGA